MKKKLKRQEEYKVEMKNRHLLLTVGVQITGVVCYFHFSVVIHSSFDE